MMTCDLEYVVSTGNTVNQHLYIFQIVFICSITMMVKVATRCGDNKEAKLIISRIDP